MIYLQTPPPTPPLEGRGAATALLATRDTVGTPLPCRGGVGGGVSELFIVLSFLKAHLIRAICGSKEHNT